MLNVTEFVAALNAKFDNGSQPVSFTVEPGRKFDNVVADTGQRSVYCFVDREGNVYKAAGWKVPAKGIRSKLETLDMEGVDRYGSWLYIR